MQINQFTKIIHKLKQRFSISKISKKTDTNNVKANIEEFPDGIDDNVVKDQEQLTEICNKIKHSNLVAIDTEFMWEKTYYPILCLIQLNVNNECFIIDIFSKNLLIKPQY